MHCFLIYRMLTHRWVTGEAVDWDLAGGEGVGWSHLLVGEEKGREEKGREALGLVAGGREESRSWTSCLQRGLGGCLRLQCIAKHRLHAVEKQDGNASKKKGEHRHANSQHCHACAQTALQPASPPPCTGQLCISEVLHILATWFSLKGTMHSKAVCVATLCPPLTCVPAV